MRNINSDESQGSRKARLARFLLQPAGKALLVLLTASSRSLNLLHLFLRQVLPIDRPQASGRPFINTSMIFAAPRTVSLGDRVDAADIVAQLRRGGYTESRSNRWLYHVRSDAIEIFPVRTRTSTRNPRC